MYLEQIYNYKYLHSSSDQWPFLNNYNPHYIILQFGLSDDNLTKPTIFVARFTPSPSDDAFQSFWAFIWIWRRIIKSRFVFQYQYDTTHSCVPFQSKTHTTQYCMYKKKKNATGTDNVKRSRRFRDSFKVFFFSWKIKVKFHLQIKLVIYLHTGLGLVPSC